MKFFQLLQDIAAQSRQNAVPLPQSDQVRKIWHGISYRFAGIDMMSGLSEVCEVASCPPVSLLLGVKPWVRGVANVRGNLITVIDLAAFLDLRAPTTNKNSRILIVNQTGLMAGLLVDEIHGLRHLDETTKIENPVPSEAKLAPYIAAGFVGSEQEEHLVLSLLGLVQSQLFMNIAA
ncbi:type IV pili signal transduction protein PilI [hydrothermal vent metagenome]|uniref:Type IV pili signal transduction protein PilI n=1 Tax=hydrothermal vent metagenome TaxID=652676 RepID=A0A3B0ZQZ0_9ZZZZ